MEQLGEIFGRVEKLNSSKQGKMETETAKPKVSNKYGMRLYTMAELLAVEFPDELWLVDGLVPEGITVLSARPASFKTWLLLDIAINVATGGLLFNHFLTEQTGVLMIDEENSARLLQQRLIMLGAVDELPVHFLVSENFKLDDRYIKKVIQFCEENDIGLITIDSLIRIYKGDENSAVDTAEVFRKIKHFTKAGISVLITHHHRKSGKTENLAQELRGSSDILAATDSHLALSRDEKLRLVLTQTKVRFAEEHEPIEIEITATDGKMEFNYLGTLKPQETKKAKTILTIKSILTERIELNQKELLAALEGAGNKVNAKTLRNTLGEMVLQEELTSTPGKGSEIRYLLRESQ